MLTLIYVSSKFISNKNFLLEKTCAMTHWLAALARELYSFEVIYLHFEKNQPSKSYLKPLTKSVFFLTNCLKSFKKIIPPQIAENLSQKLFLQKLLKISH